MTKLKFSFAIFLLCAVHSLYANFAYVANYAGNNISIVDLTNNTTMGYVNNGSFMLQNPSVVKFTPDGTKAFVLSQTNNAVFVIDPTQNMIVSEVNVGAFPFSGPTNIAITPDGTKAYVTNPGANNVSIIHIATETVTGYVNPATFPFNYPYDVEFNAAGTLAGVSNFLGNDGSVIHVATDTVVEYLNNAGFPAHNPSNIAEIGNTGAYITQYTAPSAAAVSIVTAASQSVTGYVNPNGFPFTNPRNLIISFDLQHAYIQNVTTNQISIVNIPTNTVTGYINASFQNPNAFHLTPDNSTLYVVNSNSNIVSIIDLTTNSQTGVVNSSAHPFNNPVSIDISSLITAPDPLPLIPTPPISLQGFKMKNTFPTQSDLINLITWSPSTGSDAPIDYKIYRDAGLTDLAGVVMATQPLEFTEHKCIKGNTYTYYVIAVDPSGQVSAPAQVSIAW